MRTDQLGYWSPCAKTLSASSVFDFWSWECKPKSRNFPLARTDYFVQWLFFNWRENQGHSHANSSTKGTENMMRAMGPMTHLGPRCAGVSLWFCFFCLVFFFCLSSSEALVSEIVFLNLHNSSKPKLISQFTSTALSSRTRLICGKKQLSPQQRDLKGRKAFVP